MSARKNFIISDDAMDLPLCNNKKTFKGNQLKVYIFGGADHYKVVASC